MYRVISVTKILYIKTNDEKISTIIMYLIQRQIFK